MSALLANLLWFGSSLGASRRFWSATRDVAGAQERLLLSLLQANAETAFGRAHGFGQIRSVAEYQERVPLQSWDEVAPWVERIAAGEGGVLTAEPVRLLERTSGSTAAAKLIPYTDRLKAQFNAGIAPWIVDLFRHDPALMDGQAYWSISPVARQDDRSPGGIPIGFEDDADYLGGLTRHLFGAVMAVPPEVRFLPEMAIFRYTTLLFLLRSKRLRLISVWNPTFLTLLFEPLADWWEQLVADIETGTLTLPGPVDPVIRERLEARNRPDPERARQIRAAFASGREVNRRLWPHLRLISLWTDAHAGAFAPAVARLFPQARLQGKGLIATESFASFPLTGRTGGALALTAHFFEFLEEGTGAVRLAHQLERGETYSLVVTTGGGLYRYRLHDLVEMIGHQGEAPLLRFVGKEGLISDRFGEKLHERHVSETLSAAFARAGIQPTFAMLSCEADSSGRWAYTLFIEADGAPDLSAVRESVEAGLQTNFHYQYARDLGQLEALRLFRIGSDGMGAYLRACQAQGQRAGDVKPVALHQRDGWGQAFTGRWIG